MISIHACPKGLAFINHLKMSVTEQVKCKEKRIYIYTRSTFYSCKAMPQPLSLAAQVLAP